MDLDPPSTGAGSHAPPGRAQARSMIVGIALYLILLATPGLATIARILSSKGASYFADFPAFTLQKWMNASFQNECQTWYADNFAARNFFVRNASQINYTCFREVTFKDRTGLILGKENSLYLSMYIESYYGRWALPTEVLDRFAAKVRKMQDKLRSRGVAFLFLITPSKASIEPENIPDYLVPKGAPAPSDYERLVPLLAKYGVETLDGRALTLELKKEGRYPLFPKSGFHWNSYSSFRVTEAIVSRLEALTGKPLNHLRLERVNVEPEPAGSDGDLAYHAHVWWPSVFYGTYPYPVASREAREGALVPNLLMVGDSFLDLPRHWLLDLGIAAHSSMQDAYFQQRIDPQRDLFSRDVVILGMNEGLLAWLGYGLVETVLTETYEYRPQGTPPD